MLISTQLQKRDLTTIMYPPVELGTNDTDRLTGGRYDPLEFQLCGPWRHPGGQLQFGCSQSFLETEQASDFTDILTYK